MDQILMRLESIERKLDEQQVGLPRREFLRIDEAAEFVGVSRQALDRWRLDATGPSVHRVGRRILYSVDDLREFMQRCRSEI